MDATLAAGVKIANVAEWCRANGVDRRTFYRHRARIEAEGGWQPRSRRPKVSAGQTPPEVEAEVIGLRRELAPDNGAESIVAELRQVAARDGWQQRGLRVPHRSTVHKILTRSGLVEPQPGKRPKSSYRRFAYARPRDCYQLDATEVKLAGGRAAVVFDVLDDCTRLLAACRAADAETAAAAVQAIRAAAACCGPPGIVLCDNGAAFTGGPHARGAAASAFSRAVAALGSRLIHSSPYHPQTCGKVERHHQTLKKWLATRPVPATLADLQDLLDQYRDWYNTRRHHTAVRATPRSAWDTAPSHGGPSHLPRQDDATVHQLTVGSTGNIGLGGLDIHLSNNPPGQHVTVIRDHDRVTVYTTDGQPLGHIKLNHAKRYQGTLTPAA
jgi:transposase InsO family protein